MAVPDLDAFFASNPEVRFVRFVFMDHASLLRVSVMPNNRAVDIAQAGYFNAPVTGFAYCLTCFDGMNEDAIVCGIDSIMPDWSSLKVCAFYPRHAMVMCAVREPAATEAGTTATIMSDDTKESDTTVTGKDTEDLRELDTPSTSVQRAAQEARVRLAELKERKAQIEKERRQKTTEFLAVSKPRDRFELCPRSILNKQMQRAEKAGQTIQVGIELELCLYKPGLDHSRAKSASGNFTTSVLYNEKIVTILDEITLALAAGGIDLLKYHPEGGLDGIFEMVLPPYSPMQAADAMVYFRETAKTIALRHGYEATLAPRPFEQGGSGLGAHTSISISDTGKDGAKASSFLAGILDSFLGICAFAMPSPQSSARVAASKAMRPVKWGRDNKSCIVRERNPGLWEIRAPDGTMNPYLTIAALIAAGMSGIERQMELTMKPVEKLIMRKMTEEEKDEYGVTQMLPDTLEPLLGALGKDEALKAGFGERMIKAYSGLKEREIEAAKGMTVQEIGQKMRAVF